MATTTLIRTTSLAAVAATLGIAVIGPTSASDQRVGDANAPGIQVVGSDLNARFIPLGVGKSVVIDLPRDIKDVLITDPKIANAVIRSARRAFIIGAAVGQTNIFFFDAEGIRVILPQQQQVELPSAKFEAVTLAHIDSIFGMGSASHNFYR